MHHLWHKWHHRHRKDRPGHRFGPWAWEGRFFERGDLPLALLSLLADGPKHGYELMKDLEARSRGLYRASAGTVYPTLQQLQDQEFVSSQSADGGKRVYELTDAGRRRIEEDDETVRRIWQRAEDEEWDGWGYALDTDAAAILRPAFRLMRTAVRAVARAPDPERADRVRDVLRRARQEIRDLDKDQRPDEA